MRLHSALGRSYCWAQTDDTVGVRLTLAWAWETDAPAPPAPARPPAARVTDRNAPLNGPPDWPAVTRLCTGERWQAAYTAARGCQDAAAYIEARKAEALAALVAAWRASKETTP